MCSENIRYGAHLGPTNYDEFVLVENAADLLAQTVEILIRRAPSIAAAAANELGSTVLTLHFGDGSSATLSAHLNTLIIARSATNGSVACFFDDKSLVRLYDLELHPREVLQEGQFDVRGSTQEVLAAWRTFRLLAQRGAGLRPVQNLWCAYRRVRGLDLAVLMDKADTAPGPSSLPPDAAALLRDDGVAHAPGTASVATTRVLWDRHTGEGWWTFPGPKDADLFAIMEVCRRRVADEIFRLIPDSQPVESLYKLMREYPARGGKGLRPTLCIATCGAFGGHNEDAVLIATAVEMFHNAFLIHDDIEDESVNRRGMSCLHTEHGIPLAVNTGDSLNLLAVETVLKNIEGLGLARTLALIDEIIRMCRKSLEGQAVELGWIRQGSVPAEDDDYINMASNKTGWYTCQSPCRLGAIAAGHTRSYELNLIGSVFYEVGVAFQIQDDVLNLVGQEDLYGKEALGDLLEGKRTLMLIHLMRNLQGSERHELLGWLRRPRDQRSFDESRSVLDQMIHHGSLEYAREVAAQHAAKAARLFEEKLGFIPESENKAILRHIIHYVNTRML